MQSVHSGGVGDPTALPKDQTLYLFHHYHVLNGCPNTLQKHDLHICLGGIQFRQSDAEGHSHLQDLCSFEECDFPFHGLGLILVP